VRLQPAAFALSMPPMVVRPVHIVPDPAPFVLGGRAPARRSHATVAEITALEGEFCSFAGLVSIATPVPVLLWTGVGDFAAVNSAFHPDGSVFKGAGRLIDLPSFQRIWNGQAERITLTLTGVTDDMRQIAYEEAADVRGAIVRLGLAVLGADWQQIGIVRWLRHGRVDVIETENKPGERERIKTISISLRSQMTGRRRPGAGAYSLADQQARPGSEDDRFPERTPLMTERTVIKWPNFVLPLLIAKAALAAGFGQGFLY
jgi:hypothetical protein